MARIALDAMGGDHAPAEVVAGGVEAAKSGIDVRLVGDEPTLRGLLDDLGAELPVVHAGETIGMDEDPRFAIREKKGASVSVAARMVADGDADGLYSAGSTGATVAAAALLIGRLEGIARPAIANLYLMIPSGGIVLLDGGANLECRPEHLYQFGVMGSALSTVYVGKERPRVGILNIGSEEGKGRDLEKEAYGLLRDSNLNFVGNVEGHDLGTGVADVFVTDGFTGNVLLKAAEGTARFVAQIITDVLLGRESDPQTIEVTRPKLQELYDRVDPEAYGGSHLVGAKGVVVIGHGSSSRRAVANGVGLAAEAVERGLVERIAAGLGG